MNRNDFLDRINSEFEQSFTLAARVSLEMHSLDESHRAAKRVFSYNPHSKAILDLFPQYSIVIEDISRLVQRHSQCVQEQPENADSWRILGYCYLSLGDFPNAFTAFTHSFRLCADCSDSVFWYAFGVVYAHYRYSDCAVSCVEKMLSFDSRFVYAEDVLLRTAIIERSVRNFDAALDFFERALKRPPNGLRREDIQFQIGYTWELRGSSDRAMDIYRELHARYPTAEAVTTQFCWFLYLQNKEGRLDHVQKLVEEAIRTSPVNPTLLLISARIAMRQGDIATAYQKYRVCINYCFDSPFFWCGLGVLYYKNEQTQDAVVAFQRALYLKNEMPEAWLNIGLILEERNDFASAIKIYQSGQAKCVKNAEFTERLNALNSQRAGHRKYGVGYQLIDVDDSKFVVPPPEQFADDCLAAVPRLPSHVYGVGPAGEKFSTLATFPKSLFE
jgi:tetratricopeptide (TPR) repeat protein